MQIYLRKYIMKSSKEHRINGGRRMEKKEFDKLVGIDTDPKCYERIEFVYIDVYKRQSPHHYEWRNG